MATWKVQLFEATTERNAPTAAKQLDTFGIEATDDDAARRAARAWLTERSYVVRSISFTPSGVLLAYVNPKRP